jgi:hypothetical protein
MRPNRQIAEIYFKANVIYALLWKIIAEKFEEDKVKSIIDRFIVVASSLGAFYEKHLLRQRRY